MWPWFRLGELNIPTFVLVQSLNACIILVWSRRRAVNAGFSPSTVLDFVFVCLVAGLAGGRLLHVAWEAPAYYLENLARVFDLLNGGYVYYGGLILGVLAGCALLKRRGETNLASWFDFSAPLLSFGTAIGRVGCFFAGCCYGRACTLPWAVTVFDERGFWSLRHPTQIYELVWELGVLMILLGLEATELPRRPRVLQRSGAVFATWMVLHGAGRFLVEFYRDDFRGPSFGLSISQWISLVLIAGGTAWLLRPRVTTETI